MDDELLIFFKNSLSCLTIKILFITGKNGNLISSNVLNVYFRFFHREK